MSPLVPPQPQQAKTANLAGALSMGLVIGLILSCLGSGVGFVFARRAAVEARKGWNLVPVVVAAVDITEGTSVTFEMISQRATPEQFVTSSVIKPDRASYIVNQKILVPVQAGDPLLWSQFETRKQEQVLFAKDDLKTGSALSESDLEERSMGPELLTLSWVRTKDRPKAVGKKLIAPFGKGDPILWTHLEAAP